MNVIRAKIERRFLWNAQNPRIPIATSNNTIPGQTRHCASTAAPPVVVPRSDLSANELNLNIIKNAKVQISRFWRTIVIVYLLAISTFTFIYTTAINVVLRRLLVDLQSDNKRVSQNYKTMIDCTHTHTCTYCVVVVAIIIIIQLLAFIALFHSQTAYYLQRHSAPRAQRPELGWAPAKAMELISERNYRHFSPSSSLAL